MNKRLLLTSIVTLATLFFTGCATSPYKGDGKASSDALLKQQFEAADKRRVDKPEGRLILAAFAMHSQSKAFRNDVLTAEKSVLSLDPNAIIFKLNNPAFGQDADWPYATTENIAQVLKKASAMARPEDKVVVLMSTHGRPDVLSVNFGAQYYPHVNAKVLNQWLADFRGKPTVLILSACFSGSFLQTMGGASRVILTAAAEDRSSFGCQFQSTNTYFVDALFNQPSLADSTLEQLMAQAQVAIHKKERAQKLSPPSLPQVSIGSGAKTWANQPLKDWVSAK
jgi:Peptidase C13 family